MSEQLVARSAVQLAEALGVPPHKIDEFLIRGMPGSNDCFPVAAAVRWCRKFEWAEPQFDSCAERLDVVQRCVTAGRLDLAIPLIVAANESRGLPFDCLLSVLQDCGQQAFGGAALRRRGTDHYLWGGFSSVVARATAKLINSRALHLVPCAAVAGYSGQCPTYPALQPGDPLSRCRWLPCRLSRSPIGALAVDVAVARSRPNMMRRTTNGNN
jgi:hypothetical protein